MSVSRSPAPSSIDLSGVPARVAEAVAQVCHEPPVEFEEAELRVRETIRSLVSAPSRSGTTARAAGRAELVPGGGDAERLARR